MPLIHKKKSVSVEDELWTRLKVAIVRCQDKYTIYNIHIYKPGTTILKEWKSNMFSACYAPINSKVEHPPSPWVKARAFELWTIVHMTYSSVGFVCQRLLLKNNRRQLLSYFLTN